MNSVIGTLDVEKRTRDPIINIVHHTHSKNKQLLIFNSSKRSAEKCAEDIAKTFPVQKKLGKLALSIKNSLSSPTEQCRKLEFCVERGVAFHHSGLTSRQRTLIEHSFKKGHIFVISSTPTLAAGLNLPAYKVVIKDYKRFSQRGMQDIPILEYHQMIGRAGRPGSEDVGLGVLFVKKENEVERMVSKYLFGEPEKVYSKLAVEPTLKMYLLSLISMDVINSHEEIREFFKNTFYGSQYGDIDELMEKIKKILQTLKEYKFISQEDSYFQSTPVGRKVSELYLSPDTAHKILVSFDKICNTLKEKPIQKDSLYAFLFHICNCYELKPFTTIRYSEEEVLVQKFEEIQDNLISEFDPFSQDFREVLSLVKMCDIFEHWIGEKQESFLFERYRITPGELHHKLQVIEWLLYSVEEFMLMKKEFFVKNVINKLRIRFKYGVKEDALRLIVFKGIGRVRARELVKNNLGTISKLRKVSLSTLSRILGEATARNLQKQLFDVSSQGSYTLDEKPEEIKKREISDSEVDLIIEELNHYEEEKQHKLLRYF